MGSKRETWLIAPGRGTLVRMREKSATSPEAEQAFTDLTADLADAGVVPGKMFGARALMLGGKALACLSGDELAVKLARDTPQLQSALALPGAELFDPSGKGRPFKDWVLVGSDQRAAWPSLLDDALGLSGA